MENTTYTFRDLAKSIISGGDAAKYKCVDSPTSEFDVPVYANATINEGLYGYTNMPVVTEEAVTIAARGAGVGFVAFRKPNFVPIVRLISIVPKSEIATARFLFYYLKKQAIIGGGAAIPQLTVPMVQKIKISIPPLGIQQKIASILSTYDTLIENNTKRIRLLEQMAENIYKEWFVRFRFQDYKKDEIENGIPNGWNVMTLGDIILENPKSKIKVSDANNSDDTYPFYTSGKAILKYHEYLVDGINIFVNTGGVADIKMNIGKSHYSTDTWCIKGVQDYTLFLYSYLFSIKDEIQSSYFEGAALKHLKKQSLKKKKVLVPPSSVIEKYNKQIEAMFQLITKLLIEQENLIKQRDLLLPRLMSGKLEVKP